MHCVFVQVGNFSLKCRISGRQMFQPVCVEDCSTKVLGCSGNVRTAANFVPVLRRASWPQKGMAYVYNCEVCMHLHYTVGNVYICEIVNNWHCMDR